MYVCECVHVRNPLWVFLKKRRDPFSVTRVKAQTNGETPPKVNRQQEKRKKEYNVYYMLVSILDDCYNQGPLITYPD